MRQRTLEAKIKKEQKRTISLITSRIDKPKTAFWLSFAEYDGFRGAVIVHAEDFLTALMECNLRKINPHGECRGMELTEEMTAQIPEKWKNRILSKEECRQFDAEMQVIQN